MTPTLFNPYPKQKEDSKIETIRLCIDPLKEDTFTIRSVLMDFGAVHSALAMFHKHLSNYVRDNNLTVNDREKFIKYIARLFPDVTPRPTSGGLDGEKSGRDERRGAESLYPTGEGEANKPAVKLRKQKTS